MFSDEVHILQLLAIDAVRKKQRRKSTMYHARDTLGLAVKLMKKLLIRWKVCDYCYISG